MGNKNLRPNNDVISRQVGDERVLVHLQSNEMYSLNPTGARAWELLSEGHDEEAIAATLSDEYGIDRAEAHRELETLLDEFERHNLVERA
jgi:Coenzyme PQQ synthesis protein D (PqqD)